jgi:epoxyqueuosine reductase QueG
MTLESAFQPREAPTLAELTDVSEQEFRDGFRRSPAKRTKLRGLMRNVTAALWSLDDSAAEESLIAALDHPEPFVRNQGAIYLTTFGTTGTTTEVRVLKPHRCWAVVQFDT